MKKVVVAIVLLLVVVVCWELVTAKKVVPGATTYWLPMRCELIHFDQRLQPRDTAVLACPGVDMIRLWPLPIVTPWFEDDDQPPLPQDEAKIGKALVAPSHKFCHKNSHTVA